MVVGIIIIKLLVSHFQHKKKVFEKGYVMMLEWSWLKRVYQNVITDKTVIFQSCIFIMFLWCSLTTVNQE